MSDYELQLKNQNIAKQLLNRARNTTDPVAKAQLFRDAASFQEAADVLEKKYQAGGKGKPGPARPGAGKFGQYPDKTNTAATPSTTPNPNLGTEAPIPGSKTRGVKKGDKGPSYDRYGKGYSDGYDDGYKAGCSDGKDSQKAKQDDGDGN